MRIFTDEPGTHEVEGDTPDTLRVIGNEPDTDDDGTVVSIAFPTERPTEELGITMSEFRLDLYRALQQIDRYLKFERTRMPDELLRGERENVSRLIGMVIAMPRSVRHEYHAMRDEHEEREHPIPLDEIPGTWALPIQEMANFASVQFPTLQASISAGEFDEPLDTVRLEELREVISDALGQPIIGVEDRPEKPSNEWPFLPPADEFDPDPPPPVRRFAIVY
ncbi:hypothetical protein COU78_01730 [Candidatus Peregrinibacteria bacterium CG10_big_fil_rev_8_21_14_0_10_49_24]|nr:MAG: hypothetical protein COV83_00365 [Candidatus Peregrinibacteria bacterium CG11_big_fil_rev_8_21_14_0_20_49_14]PIR51442.1 MAG: hypothetical protein COU78_01730 [Candidatus Peregrinibacteria bacterium CG10_big_fil_rev_8_21_14_0_10_49_24]PJA67378.1 MAG: hypothetical protein CO157_04960 [Candidatus Peregrinibacteria bacterium CG_4_9_14_3_um_filter_49_12]